MKNKLVIFTLLLFSCFCFAQNEKLSSLYQVPFTLYKTTTDTLGISDMDSLRFQDKASFLKTQPNDIYWAKLDFFQYDSLLSKNNWILQIGYLNKAKIFYQTETGIKSQVLGAFQLNKNFTGEFLFKKKNLIDGRYLYLKFLIVSKRVGLEHKNILLYKEEYQPYLKNVVYTEKRTAEKTSQLFLGSALFVILMAFLFYRTHQRREYIYYALYVVALILYLCRISSDLYDRHIGIFSHYNYVLNTILEMAGIIFYLLFTRYFLNTKTTYPVIDKIITVFTRLLLLLIVIDSAVLLLEYYQLHLLILDSRIIALSAMELFGVLYLIVYRKDRITWFIIIGSLLFSVGSLCVFIFSDFNYLRIASLLEIMVFLLGLGYKIRTGNKEKMYLQQMSIQNYRKLLRTQINPHFLFNSLNSIQHLITKNERVLAIKYLNKFSKLMRQTLESSIENNILLSEEITFLNTYLELESFRFDESFQYQINIDENLFPNNIEIPQLMIQPFVENAILHGLLNKKEGEKILTISFSERDNLLKCIIDDNGIGRRASETMKRFAKNKKSRGMEVTQKRIDELYSEEIKQQLLTVIDKTDAYGNPDGTTVILIIPLPQ